MLGKLKFVPLAGVLMVATLKTTPAWGARVVLDTPGDVCFSLHIPPGWQVASPLQPAAKDDQELPRIVSLFPDPTAQVWLGVWHTRLAGSLEEAKQKFDNLGDFILENPKVSVARERTLGEFPAYEVLGTAMSDGESVTFGVVTFEYAPGAIGVGIYLSEDAEWRAQGETLAETLETIRAEQAACRTNR